MSTDDAADETPTWEALRELVVAAGDAHRFRAEPVPREVLEELVAAATARVPERFVEAPWRFVVVVGDAREQLVSRVAEALGRHWGLGPAASLPRGLALRAVLDAPALVLVFSRLPATEGLEGVAVAAGAAQQLVLLAHARGLATHRTFSPNLVPEAVVDFAASYLDPSIRTAELVTMLALGYPAEPPPAATPPLLTVEWVGLRPGRPPVPAPAAAETATPRPAVELRSTSGERVYLVDPYPHNRDTLGQALTAAGYVVTAFAEGTALLARSREAPPDLYLVNDALPDTSGFELVRLLLGEGEPRPPVLLTTARPDAAFRIGGLAAGVDYYLRRPVNATELLVAARILLHRRRLLEQLQSANAELSRLLGELRTAQSRMVQQAKLASLGELVAGVAHEINTPLGAVVSNNDLFMRVFARLRRGVRELATAAGREPGTALARDLAAVEELTGTSQQACRRITELVRTLRTFARPDEGGRQLCDLHEGLESTLKLVRHLMGPDIVLRRDFGELPRVECQLGPINQVFMNVLVNAVQAIDGPGAITVRTRAVGDRVRIVVEDTGHGIPAENLARIFDPGFTTKGPGIGTGLGLSICYRIVAAHDGEIAVESEVGKGTAFTITLPVRGRS